MTTYRGIYPVLWYEACSLKLGFAASYPAVVICVCNVLNLYNFFKPKDLWGKTPALTEKQGEIRKIWLSFEMIRQNIEFIAKLKRRDSTDAVRRVYALLLVNGVAFISSPLYEMFLIR